MDIPQGNATYDAARANMGSPWKMPTYDQANELINGTNSTWTTLNGINGMKFTLKTNTSKYIFLSAAGKWDNTTHYFVTQTGYYWTTKHDTSSPLVQCLGLNSNSLTTASQSPESGFTVRPVR